MWLTFKVKLLLRRLVECMQVAAAGLGGCKGKALSAVAGDRPSGLPSLVCSHTVLLAGSAYINSSLRE